MSSLPSTVCKIHHLLRKSWLTMKKLRMYSMVESLFNKYKVTDTPPARTTVKQSQRVLGVHYSSVSKVHTVPIRNWVGYLATKFKIKKKKKRQQKQCRRGREIGETLGFASQLNKPSCQVPGPCERAYLNKTDQNNRTKQLRWIMPEEWHLSSTPSPMYTHLHTHEDQNQTELHTNTQLITKAVYPERAL